MYFVRFSFLLSMFFILFFLGCAQVSPSKSHDEKPLWLSERENLSSFEAIGFARVNFQGMHMQRMEALTQARAQLSESISSYVTLEYTNKINTYTSQVQKNQSSFITSLSKHLLANSYQADAYIDEQNNLYLLVKIQSTAKLREILGDEIGSHQALKPLATQKFDIQPLLERRCYSEQTLQNIQTKYPMYKGKPLWFYRPNNENKNTAIGIAEQTYTSTFESQKKAALTIAKMELGRKKQIQIDSLYTLSDLIIQDQRGRLDTHKVDTKAKVTLSQTILKDIWMDPKQCELYVWIEEIN